MHIMSVGCVILVGIVTISTASAEGVTLRENETTTVECSYDKDEPAIARAYENRPDKGVYHYNVFIPEGYHAHTNVYYPCIFINSPGGDAPMDNVRQFAQDRRWIVIMLVESRNGPSGPSIGNFLAAHDDVIKKLRIMEGRKILTGFSGGAREASLQVGMRPGFAGVILQGAAFNQFTEPPQRRGRYNVEAVRQNNKLLVCGIFGDSDENLSEIKRLKKGLPASTLSMFMTFAGGHDWAPVEKMQAALDWIEDKSMQMMADKKVIAGTLMHRTFAGGKGRTPIQEYRDAVEGLRQIDKYALGSEPGVRQLAEVLRSRETGLAGETKLKSEIAAFQEYEKALAIEKASREEMAARALPPIFVKTKLQGYLAKYQSIVTQYAGTECGELAQQKIQALQGELSSLDDTSSKRNTRPLGRN